MNGSFVLRGASKAVLQEATKNMEGSTKLEVMRCWCRWNSESGVRYMRYKCKPCIDRELIKRACKNDEWLQAKYDVDVDD